MSPDPNLLAQWVRDETLVRIVFKDGENLVDAGYIRASPLDCFISHVRPDGVYVRENGAMWLFRFARVVGQTNRGVCPCVISITPISEPDTEQLADAAEQDALVEQMMHLSQGYTIDMEIGE